MTMINKVKKTVFTFVCFLATVGVLMASEQGTYDLYMSALNNQRLENEKIQAIDKIFYQALDFLIDHQRKYCPGDSCNNKRVIANYIKNGDKILDLTSYSSCKHILPSDKEMKILCNIRSFYCAIAILPFTKQQKVYDLNYTCMKSHNGINQEIDFSILLKCMQLSYEKTIINSDHTAQTVSNNQYKTYCNHLKSSCQK